MGMSHSHQTVPPAHTRVLRSRPPYGAGFGDRLSVMLQRWTHLKHTNGTLPSSSETGRTVHDPHRGHC